MLRSFVFNKSSFTEQPRFCKIQHEVVLLLFFLTASFRLALLSLPFPCLSNVSGAPTVSCSLSSIKNSSLPECSWKIQPHINLVFTFSTAWIFIRAQPVSEEMSVAFHFFLLTVFTLAFEKRNQNKCKYLDNVGLNFPWLVVPPRKHQLRYGLSPGKPLSGFQKLCRALPNYCSRWGHLLYSDIVWPFLAVLSEIHPQPLAGGHCTLAGSLLSRTVMPSYFPQCSLGLRDTHTCWLYRLAHCGHLSIPGTLPFNTLIVFSVSYSLFLG